MADDSSQNKTEQPTSKKLSDARKKGNVPQTKEIPSVLILAGSIGVLFFGSSWMLERLIATMRSTYQRAGVFTMAPETIHTFLWEVFFNAIKILAPLMVVVIIAGVCGNIAQFGFLFTTEKLTPNLTKLNPVSGIKRLFSLKALVEVVKSILKLIIIGGIAYAVFRPYMDQIPALMQLSVGSILTFTGQVSFQICFYVCITLSLLALLDFAYTKWQHNEDLKMTKQEVKDEHKQTEGDPKVKARIRSVQRELARQRMMDAVPEATVVITNPTHLAIALKYDKDVPAPIVIAKGAGYVAQKIKKIALENDVPMVENKPLARAMFKASEVGDFIPAELYQAVAEVLAYVYRLKGLAQ